MPAALIALPAVLLLTVLSIGAFLLLRLRYFRFYNYVLYGVLAAVWITNGFFGETRYLGESTWLIPAMLSAGAFIPAALRLPLAYIARKLDSRKIPLLITNTSFLILIIPFFAAPSLGTYFCMVIGFCISGAAFGSNNNYFSENWTGRHLYTTYALLSLLPVTGIFAARLAHGIITLPLQGSAVFDLVTMRWVLIGFACALALILSIYAARFPLRPKIVLANNSIINEVVSKLSFKKLLRLFITPIFLSFYSGFFNTPHWFGAMSDASTSVFSVAIVGISVLTSVLTALVLVHYIALRTIFVIGKVLLVLGGIMQVLVAFLAPQVGFLMMGGALLTAMALGMLDAAYFGYAVHIDAKSRYFIIGTYLSFRSVGNGVSDLSITSAVTPTSVSTALPWLAVAGLALALAIGGLHFAFRRYTRQVAEMVTVYEKVFYRTTKQFLWKPRHAQKSF